MIIDDQIKHQIEGKITVDVIFPENTDTIRLYIQRIDNKKLFFIEPAFCKSKIISEALFNDLVHQFKNEKEFNTDNEKIITELDYDSFFERYYN